MPSRCRRRIWRTRPLASVFSHWAALPTPISNALLLQDGAHGRRRAELQAERQPVAVEPRGRRPLAPADVRDPGDDGRDGLVNPTACKRLFSMGGVPHTDGGGFQGADRLFGKPNAEFRPSLEKKSLGSGREPSVGPQNLCRLSSDCDTFLFKASSEPGTPLQSVFALSTHETDKIRLVNTPAEETEDLKACIRTAVAQAWPKGIQRERVYGGCPEFKIKGR